MKFYMFAGSTYYPSGGTQDFIGFIFDPTVEGAKEQACHFFANSHYDWWELANEEMQCVYDNSGAFYVRDGQAEVPVPEVG